MFQRERLVELLHARQVGQLFDCCAVDRGSRRRGVAKAPALLVAMPPKATRCEGASTTTRRISSAQWASTAYALAAIGPEYR